MCALALVSMGAGYLLRGLRQPAVAEPVTPFEEENYEIRGGLLGLTNPLLECEVAGYRRGRELRPFRTQIEALVNQLLAAHAAERISLYFRDLDSGPSFGIRATEGFTGASLLKVPTIVAALLKVQESPAFLARTIRFSGYPGQESPGQYVPEVQLVPGQVYTVDELLRRAGGYSDNAAAGVVKQLVGPEYVGRVHRELAVPSPPADRPHAPIITPREYGHLFRVLYNATYLNRPLSERALTYFTQSAFHDGLEAGVPPGTTVAHKFGIYDVSGENSPLPQLHDCGIVYRPGRPYFLCVMTEGRDVDTLAEVIHQISRAVFLAIDSQSSP